MIRRLRCSRIRRHSLLFFCLRLRLHVTYLLLLLLLGLFRQKLTEEFVLLLDSLSNRIKLGSFNGWVHEELPGVSGNHFREQRFFTLSDGASLSEQIFPCNFKIASGDVYGVVLLAQWENGRVLDESLREILPMRDRTSSRLTHMRSERTLEETAHVGQRRLKCKFVVQREL